MESQPLGEPRLPKAPRLSVDGLSLTEIRDMMGGLSADPAIERDIEAIVQQWRVDPRSLEPIAAIRAVLDRIRIHPRGDARLAAMNTFVRMLGEREALATFLDMLRDSAGRLGTDEEKLTRWSRQARKHAVYGWAGQTLLLFSGFEPTDGTTVPEEGVVDLVGETPPPAVWGLSMHIWQPNPTAEGFSSGGRIASDIVVEPPHSHPFDFASMVSTGTMRQSIYRQGCADGTGVEGRYDGVSLEHVDGVWPEHHYRSTCELTTVEQSVAVGPGDSYFLPCDVIHDVEFNVDVAATAPAITLFLASEVVVKPHVYMAASMADAHDAEPQLKEQGSALSQSAWNQKLEAVSAYLRGEQDTLRLDDIVNHRGKYAFFHAA